MISYMQIVDVSSALQVAKYSRENVLRRSHHFLRGGLDETVCLWELMEKKLNSNPFYDDEDGKLTLIFCWISAFK